MSQLNNPKVINVVAAAILNDEGQLLLARKRGTQAFMQPGGKIEPGENPRQALARELSEELSADLSGNNFTYLGKFSEDAANEPDHRVEAEIFATRYSGKISPRAEIEELLWLNMADHSMQNLAPLTKNCIIPTLLENGLPA